MSIQGAIRRWWYWQKMAAIDRKCKKLGHDDYGCYSVTGSVGDKCQRCGRILWQRRDGSITYQEPTRLAESNWR